MQICRMPLLLLLLLQLRAEAAEGENAAFDRKIFDARVRETIDFCPDSPADAACAARWIDVYDRKFEFLFNVNQRLQFAHSLDLTGDLGEKMMSVSSLTDSWVTRHLKIARKFRWREFKNRTLRRRFQLLTGGFQLKDKKDRKQSTQLQQSLQSSYSQLISCRAVGDCLKPGEHEAAAAMQEEADYDVKLAIWKSWYDSASSALMSNFTEYVRLQNRGAREAGFKDAGSAEWQTDFESKTFDSDVMGWWDRVSDLYLQLHAYVRHKLSLAYPGRFNASGCVPVHLFGDQWAQQWQLPQSDMPYPNASALDVTRQLQKKFKNFTQLVEQSEKFYESLGLPKMTKEFWQRSDFLKPANSSVVKDCHASASEFGNRRDFRIKMCAKIDRENFYTVHHEMGHVQYFMAYSDKPLEFRSGANSGFHEAIGDTAALSVDNLGHYRKIGLMGSGTDTYEQRLNQQMSMALQKVAFLPFALAAGIFRWRVYNGSIGFNDMNAGWWRLRAELGGVCPPVDRPSVGFDAGAKYHVALDISYARYFCSFLLQFQFYRRLCSLSGNREALNECDFGGSRVAGERLRELLSSGSSHPWQETLKKFDGTDSVDPAAILEYFRPLHRWLADYNSKHRLPVGWTAPGDSLKGVTL